MSETDPPAALADRIAASVSRAAIGLDAEARALAVALVAGGHVLLEGPPGVAKTFLARSFARAIGAELGRVQFTPDLMPADVIGTSVYRAAEERFEFVRGPIFAEVLLCDEINRAPAKTQAALLEAMQERTVTADGVRHPLPAPFIVIATQNPLEHEGTYPLPEAQLDRFLFKLRVGYPPLDVEHRLLSALHPLPLDVTPAGAGVETVASVAELHALAGAARAVTVRDDVVGYVARLLDATRRDAALSTGASPRAGVAWLAACKAAACLAGRDWITPDDVKAYALPVLRHRVRLDAAEELAGTTSDDVVARLLDTVEVPR